MPAGTHKNDAELRSVSGSRGASERRFWFQTRPGGAAVRLEGGNLGLGGDAQAHQECAGGDLTHVG